MIKTTSITDNPITSARDSLLNIDHHATALAEFISEGATPLTIGMQGEWGTGKTSLMHLVKEKLDEKDLATSWVNTWEYSLFRQPSEVTPNVLKGLLENLVKTCKEKNYWGTEQKYDAAVGQLKKGLKILGSLAAKAAVKSTTGINVDIASSESMISEVADLKIQIQEIVNLIIKDDQNPAKKIVFFVDDLDRIDPPMAVEVLESLKNVFDVDNCTFILAIDYDVVIKGLEKKFGKKTEQNEREFRSFFDKIIQVPFSMPTGAYDIDNLLSAKLSELGLELDKDLEADYVNIVKLTVGYIPRSIKRYVNSFSLLEKIRLIGDNGSEEKLVDFCLFALLGIQISYPQIYRLINIRNDFLNWDKSFALQIGVDTIDDVPDMDAEFTDEEWEQVLWSFCQRDPYLRARALAIIQVLNVIRDKLADDLPIILERSMEYASMTSVDDDVEAKQATGKYQRTLYEGIDGYTGELKSNGVGSEYIELLEYVHDDIEKIFKDKEDKDDVNYLYSVTGGVTVYAQGKMKGTKFVGLKYSKSGMPHVEICLLKDPRNGYKKPRIDNLEITNVRSYTSKSERKKLPFIEYYLIKLKDKSEYSDKIKNLINASFEIRQQGLKILKKGMHTVQMSIDEDDSAATSESMTSQSA